jgi:MoCo/4Fe-4S cofactor protein with predicted Tat translocation signal
MSEGRRRYWKSLEDLAETPAFLEILHREFPAQASELTDPSARREFLKLMGASLALAGLTACTRQPRETVVPYVRAPEDVVPGRPLFFSTAVLDGGYAKGVLVESHLGRPTKVEGNPEHPASLGATDVFGQAWVLGLYDPDRSQTLTFRGEIRPWSSFLATLRGALDEQRPRQGAGLRLLTGNVTSPTLFAQLQEILAAFPAARWHQYEAAVPQSALSAALGHSVQYRLDTADVIVSLEADFIGSGPGNLSYIRQYASRRKRPDLGQLNRLYVAESAWTLTGAKADHRLPVRSSQIEELARALSAGLGSGSVPGGPHQAWIQSAARDLQQQAGRSLVMPGEFQPVAVHRLAEAMNQRLGNVGRTVTYGSLLEARPVDAMASLRELVADMKAGRVELLVILDGNPVYSAPGDLDFAGALDKVPLRIHLGEYDDETAERCEWHIPAAHPLETWGDARAFDGTLTILQPLIAPLYGGKSPHELLAAFSARPDRTAHDVVKDFWRGRMAAGDFEAAWRRALHDGVVSSSLVPPAPAGTAPAASTSPASPVAESPVPGAAPSAGTGNGLEVLFRPDPSVHDGRFSNLGWLQELPKPITKLTWENAALLSPPTARRLGLTEGDVAELRYRGRTLRTPVWTVPGQADETVVLHLGYGRRRAGRVGNAAGFDASYLRTSDAPWVGTGAQMSRTGDRHVFACTQEHWTIDAEAARRNLIRSVALEEYRKDPGSVKEMGEAPPRSLTLLPERRSEGHAWGMAIDLNSCVGCNACITACQAENNIPVVGKDQVARGREMFWLRVDRYYTGDPYRSDTVGTHFQPLPCMQCENAPCEVVCPVGATVHSDEGLNDQVYNRCIGTRYCSNNCPYKVRRFNFFLYQDWDTPTFKMQRNPDVSIRSRGVMEKCTYCVQRINQARILARNEGRPIRDGDVQTACQSVCPAEAIVFGDLNDPQSHVARLKTEARNYSLLEELGTRPRTTYLAQVTNPNPELERG